MGAVLRFAVEIVAWVAAPWALWGWSPWVAVAAVVVLVGLPTVFATPGDKANVIVPVSGLGTILLTLLQFVTAVVAAAFAWNRWVAVAVAVLVVAAIVAQGPRWRWLWHARLVR
ncbi:hypothetical protein Air01nite_53500 [Asanoa iriomotensis]|uniref:Uncharacterized protein n=1 Tax=Asanoa iriomotensis TaxID=234613 RepID=A0ABQ4C8Z9_9ACTN|nr:hypothetical protein Air01nite_53500 [Asanoa iriomotensis]